jgi:hypothetical protein
MTWLLNTLGAIILNFFVNRDLTDNQLGNYLVALPRK